MIPIKTRIQAVHLRDPMLELNSESLDWLTQEESIRYQSISAANRKAQFLAGHFLVRKMASQVYKNHLADWIYSVDPNHQRRLKCRQAEIPELYVSLSHSSDWVAAGISEDCIGIDIETFSKQRDFIAIASHVFSESDTDYLKSLDPNELAQQFYLYWTLKECTAKQDGAGLKFEVSRSQTLIPATAPELATIVSWLCPEFVLAVSLKSVANIEIAGLHESAENRFWQTIPA